MKIIERAVEIAERRGMNQTQLARAIGVSKSRITRWLKGTGFPNAAQIAALADAIDVSEPELTGLPPRGTAALWRELEPLLAEHGAEKCIRWITTGATRLHDGANVESHVGAPKRRQKGTG